MELLNCGLHVQLRGGGLMKDDVDSVRKMVESLSVWNAFVEVWIRLRT